MSELERLSERRKGLEEKWERLRSSEKGSAEVGKAWWKMDRID
jgi:hypothetical protein